MENAPTIILFWCLGIVIFIAAIALMAAGMILIKKGKKQGKICLVLSVICSIPVILVIGYMVYLWL